MALPSFSFGAEGVEYGRAASYYATTAGNEVFPDDVNVQGNLTVEGNTTLRGTGVNGSLTVSQGLTGGTRTAYFTNGGSPPAEKSVAIFNDQSSGTLTAWRNNGNEGTLQFDGGVTSGQFVLNRPLVVQANTQGSNGNVVVGGKALVYDGIYGGSLTTPVSFPAGFTSGGASDFGPTTTSTLNATGQVSFTNVAGTYASPLILQTGVVATLQSSGMIRIPFSDIVQSGLSRFLAEVQIPGNFNSVLMVFPTGNDAQRDPNGSSFQSAVVNANPIDGFGNRYRLTGWTPSTASVGRFMEAYYVVINGTPV